MDDPIDISGLSAQEKRALLTRLLVEQTQASATAHPLSYGQRSLWFLHNLAPASPAYTITYAGRITGELDVPALERAAQALVDRHAILRTTYAMRDDAPVQLVHPKWPVQHRSSRARAPTRPSCGTGCAGSPIAHSTCRPARCSGCPCCGAMPTSTSWSWQCTTSPSTSGRSTSCSTSCACSTQPNTGQRRHR